MKLTVFLVPMAKECKNFNPAEKGEMAKPISPFPNPLKKPLTPPFFVSLIGCKTTPITPFFNSLNPPINPSRAPVAIFEGPSSSSTTFS